MPLKPALMAKIHQVLDLFHELFVLITGVIAQDIHIESGALLDHGLADAPGADHGDGLARHFISEKGQERMPCPPALFTHLQFAGPELTGEGPHHEEGKLGGGIGKNIGRMVERNFVAVGIGAVDIVKTDGNLGNNF